MSEGHLYWITGLSGAGKTTVGRALYSRLKEGKDNVLLLDGDVLREVYRATDYSPEGRKALAYQHSRLCKLLTDQGIDVVICLIAMYEECRKWNRDNIKNYHEIYLKVSIEELIKRDQKQLYSKALENKESNVLGINAPFEEPEMPELIIENEGIMSVAEIVNKIMEVCSEK